jgi:FSR family fosmidomycin resistance protein-like MFS transporter
LLASCLFNPSSGAFVGLSQASLMDAQPARREQNMARWTFAGSLGVTLGPLALSAAAWLGWGWRGLFAVLAGLSLLTLAAAAGLLSRDSGKVRAVKTQIDATNVDGEPEDTEGEKTRVDAEEVLGNAERGEDRPLTFRESLRGALAGLRRGEVLRWLALLEFSDLMLDVLYAYLALYLVDVVGVSVENAGLGVAVWTGVGLLGDFLLIPLLERVKGLTYLRVSVLVEMTLYPMFLLLQPFPAKVAVLGLLGFFNAGWYAVLSGQLFDAMPGRSGAVLTLKNVAGWFGTLIPLGVGLAAQYLGLSNAMWLLLAGPLALLVGLPRRDLAARNSA